MVHIVTSGKEKLVNVFEYLLCQLLFFVFANIIDISLNLYNIYFQKRELKLNINNSPWLYS